ncbi:hypothetical protein DID74_00500 [Candidatus Marinamargulisbacteria bacterium SCGC AG-333-B06]|nr:hypothetical protein DID74_00500 [Candidatus Marinamargulisbacteria bacterium SCGC AG-333-B06]
MPVFLQKKKPFSLRKYLIIDIIKLLPLQDETIVIEWVLSFFKQAEEFQDIRCIDTAELSLMSEGYPDLMAIETVIQHSEIILFPIKYNHNLIIMIQMKLEEGIKFKDVKQELRQLHGLITFMLARILFVKQLSQKNNELENNNDRLNKLNQILKKQLTNELINHYKNYEITNNAIKKDLAIELTKELGHEINNLLSTIQFDIIRMELHYDKNNIDKNLLEMLIRYYSLNQNDLKSLLDYDAKRKLDTPIIETLKPYPMLYQYLKMILANKCYKNVNHNNKIAIEHISDIVSKMVYDKMFESNQRKIWDLNTIIKESIQLFKNRCQLESINLKIMYSNKKCFVLANKTTLFQIIINIVKNSLESMKKGSNHELMVKLLKKENSCILNIADSGSGFSDLPSDYANKHECNHLGLGIPIIKSLVSEINGHIEWQKKDWGTCVKLELPVIIAHNKTLLNKIRKC